MSSNCNKKPGHISNRSLPINYDSFWISYLRQWEDLYHTWPWGFSDLSNQRAPYKHDRSIHPQHFLDPQISLHFPSLSFSLAKKTASFIPYGDVSKGLWLWVLWRCWSISRPSIWTNTNQTEPMMIFGLGRNIYVLETGVFSTFILAISSVQCFKQRGKNILNGWNLPVWESNPGLAQKLLLVWIKSACTNRCANREWFKTVPKQT